MSRLASLRGDERGFAMVLGVTLMTLLATVSLTLLDLAQGESQRSRRDAKSDGAYQAAEAATNAYLSDLTESQVFPTSYMAKGEQARIDLGHVVHLGSSTADVPWSSGTSWTYGSAPASDPDWFDLGNGYQYLLQVYPAGGVSGPAQTITRIEAIGRPSGSTDLTTWSTIETMLRPTSLADFQTFVATSITYGSSATTYGPIFVGEDKSGTPGNLTHWGTAQANLYAEGSVFGTPTLQNGAKKYDKNSIPTALCKLNNCSPIPFSTFGSTLTTVSGAATSGGVSLAATDPTNSALSTQAYSVDAWQIVFQSNGTMLISSCKKYKTSTTTYEVYDGTNAPVCGPATLRNVPANGAIYSAVDVIVSGTVHGRVTVATSADVVIGGNTTYVTSGSDVLGLEAQGSIYVAPWAVTGTSLTVYAAALALNGPFTADPKWVGSATATFNYYGSIAAYGSTSGAIVMSNLFAARNYFYDTTLKFLQPPYFPSLGNAFTILVQRQL
jgi:hypothetical protein